MGLLSSRCDTPCILTGSDLDFSTPWREDYEEHREALAGALYTVHPVLRRAVDVWTAHAQTVLSDTASLSRRLPRPAKPEELLAMLRSDVDKAEDALTSGCVRDVLLL